MGCTQRFGYAPEYKSAASSGSEGREIVLGCSLLMPPQNLVALSVHDGAPTRLAVARAFAILAIDNAHAGRTAICASTCVVVK
jgi:hypothetical protein